MNKFKIFLGILAFIGLSLGAKAQVTVVDSGYCGGVGDGKNLEWKLTSDSVLTISGSGEMDNYDYYAASWSSNADKIKTVIIGNDVTTIGHATFLFHPQLASVNIGNSVTTIGNYAFFNCLQLTSVSIPNSVTTIEHHAFGNCGQLSFINIPNSVITIDDGAFQSCLQLTSVNIGDSVTTIGHEAFSYCSQLTSVSIPNSITTIGINAFGCCTQLTSIDVDNTNPNYSSIDGILYSKLLDTLIQCPAGKTGTISIPDSVITIGYAAFVCCSQLTSVSIPNSATTIENRAFENCIQLTSVSIGNSVMMIGNLAFYPCAKLDTIICKANIPPTIDSISTFGNVPTMVHILVPCGSKSAYQNTTGWNIFTDYRTLSTDSTSYNASFCNGTTYSDSNFSNLTKPGIYYNTLQNVNGCDSIVCLTLYLAYKDTNIINATICEGDTYQENGFNESLSGTYIQNLQNRFGYDSIVCLNLTVNQTYITQISDSISTGDFYNFFGKLLTSNGIYYDTLQTIFGCDSIIELTLTVIPDVGIVETDNYPSLQVYPNPTNGQLTIECRDGARPVPTEEYTIYSVMGQVVMRGTLPCRDAACHVPTTINVESLANGMYYLKIADRVVRFVKE